MLLGPGQALLIAVLDQGIPIGKTNKHQVKNQNPFMHQKRKGKDKPNVALSFEKTWLYGLLASDYPALLQSPL